MDEQWIMGAGGLPEPDVIIVVTHHKVLESFRIVYFSTRPLSTTWKEAALRRCGGGRLEPAPVAEALSEVLSADWRRLPPRVPFL